MPTLYYYVFVRRGVLLEEIRYRFDGLRFEFSGRLIVEIVRLICNYRRQFNSISNMPQSTVTTYKNENAPNFYPVFLTKMIHKN